MSLEVRLVLRVLVVGIDLQRMLLDDRAQQIKAGVLIPPPAFIEIDEREKCNGAQQRRGLPARKRFFGGRSHRTFRARREQTPKCPLK